ncbi:MAG: EndoU domain-containing protein [Acholeplasmataceae bacterium]|nr:EndoU domain-containing protein [Acholeplasmataceae bacterium]
MVYTDTVNSSLSYTLTFTYDNSGNVIEIDDTRGTSYDKSFTWEERSLISQTIGSMTSTYTYNQDGIRDSKTVGSVTTTYYLNGSLVLYETDGTNEIYYTYDVDGSLISMRYNGSEYFYMFDALGNVSYLIDSAGYTVVYYRYDAYGNITAQTSSALANANPYRYRGYRYDQESGLYYLQSRYYNPVTGRFINADGMLKASNTVLGYNMFTYTENNPVMNVDPSGYCYLYTDDDGNTSESLYGCASGGGVGTPVGGGGILGGGGSRFTGTIPYNDVYNTDINSGMGNMIFTYGPTYYWMTGTYIHGSPMMIGDMNHVLYEDEFGGGGHMDFGQPLNPGKTYFPRNWNENNIYRVINSVIDSPTSYRVSQGPYVRYEGWYDGVYMRVVTYKSGGVKTAYPLPYGPASN